MSWRDAMSPARMDRVALVAPAAHCREMLAEVARSANVELDLPPAPGDSTDQFERAVQAGVTSDSLVGYVGWAPTSAVGPLREALSTLQGLGLVKGDRVAVMMPNVMQYPLAVAGIMRAGYTLVNVNPLYTARELEHQLKDSGAKAIVILENFAATLEKCIASTPVKHVVMCAMGDQLGLLKGTLVNYVVRNVKKMVPDYNLPGAVRFNAAIAKATSGTFKKTVL